MQYRTTHPLCFALGIVYSVHTSGVGQKLLHTDRCLSPQLLTPTFFKAAFFPLSLIVKSLVKQYHIIQV